MARGVSPALVTLGLVAGGLLLAGVAYASADPTPLDPETDDEPEHEGPMADATYILDGSPPSANFSWKEVSRSSTAEAKGINNEPDTKSKQNAIRLARTRLQPLRERVGALTIVNWYRSPALNAAIPGASKTSAHLTGDAADVTSKTLTAQDIAEVYLALDLPFDQLISYGTTHHLHIGAGRGERRELIRYDRPGGKSAPWAIRPAVLDPQTGKLRTSSGKLV